MLKFLKHFLFCLIVILSGVEADGQGQKIDSLLTLLKKDKQDTTRVIHLGQLGRAFLKAGKTDTAFILGNQAIELCLSIRGEFGKKKLGPSYNFIGNIFFQKQDYNRSLEFYKKTLMANTEIANKKNIAISLSNIGLVYHSRGDFVPALEFYLKALKQNEDNGFKNGIASCLGNIGVIYSDQKEYAKALTYFFRALKINEEMGNQETKANNFGNIGSAYQQKGDLDKALEYEKKALTIFETFGNLSGMENNYGNIGNIYNLKNNSADAIVYYQKALKIAEELKDKSGIARNHGNIGSLYLSLKKYPASFENIYKAIHLSDSLHELNYAKEWYHILSDLYDQSDVPLLDVIGRKTLSKDQMRQRALYCFKKYTAIRDTLFSEENKKQLVRKEMNYDFEKREDATQAEQDKKDAVTKIIIYSISGGLALVLLMAVFIFRGYRQKQKANVIISKQKQLVEEKQKDILDSIHYARRIQQSLLPTAKYIDKNLKELTKK